MKRIVVLGGNGFFGGLIVEKLRAAGLAPLVASRTTADMRVDANNADDLKANLRQRDVVIDAAGPFQSRNSALIDAAARMGFDVIDINDCVQYALMVRERAAPIASAGIRVLSSCSAFSTVSAAALGLSSISQPRRLTAYFRPAARLSASKGLFSSLLSSLNGRRRTLQLPAPLGERTGLLGVTADAVTLPLAFATLRDVELVVDSGIPGGNLVMFHSMTRPKVREIASRFRSALTKLAKKAGPKAGALAYEIAASGGAQKHQVFSGENVHLVAVLPAVMAAQSIVAAKFPHRGVVPPAQHVVAEALFDAMFREGIAVVPPWGT